MMVYCVMCIRTDQPDIVHIFSTLDKADAFCATDDRVHVRYDYLLDAPERMEGTMQS